MQRNNIKYIISYIIFITLFILGAVFYKQPFFTILILLLLILPVLSVYATYKFIPKLKVTAVFAQNAVTAGNPVDIIITVDNKSLFSFLNVDGEYKLVNLFYPNNITNKISLSAPLKRANSVKFTYEAYAPGMMEFYLYTATVTDPLHLHTFRLPCDITLHLPVYPEKKEEDYPVFPAAFSDCDEEDTMPGSLTQSMDLREIREFRPGDRLKDIHWKATAASLDEDLLVREYEKNADRIIVLLPELSKDNLSKTISTFYSYMSFLIKKREVFKVFLYDGDSFTEYPVTDNDDVDKVLLQSYYMPVHNAPEHCLYSFKNLYGSDREVLWIKGDEVLNK